jgi:NAD(P)-dependent dehydrogenase (short-subunit alcohol dehydrogenase family)
MPRQLRPEGRAALVTGGSPGIGQENAWALAGAAAAG